LQQLRSSQPQAQQPKTAWGPEAPVSPMQEPRLFPYRTVIIHLRSNGNTTQTGRQRSGKGLHARRGLPPDADSALGPAAGSRACLRLFRHLECDKQRRVVTFEQNEHGIARLCPGQSLLVLGRVRDLLLVHFLNQVAVLDSGGFGRAAYRHFRDDHAFLALHVEPFRHRRGEGLNLEPDIALGRLSES
jgi:hypothetical protein